MVILYQPLPIGSILESFGVALQESPKTPFSISYHLPTAESAILINTNFLPLYFTYIEILAFGDAEIVEVWYILCSPLLLSSINLYAFKVPSGEVKPLTTLVPFLVQ